MKCIKAIIQHQTLPHLLRSLEQIDGFPGITVSEVLGSGRESRFDASFDLTPDDVPLHHRRMIEIVADDATAPRLVECIRIHAHTGHPGDGLITVAALESVTRIRTAEVKV